MKTRITALFIFLLGASLGFFLYQTNTTIPFQLGLDLSGGSYLVYEADVAEVPEEELEDRMEALRDVIERRVNLFGVSEPSVQTETGSGQQRLVVELPGVTDLAAATEMIGQTPLLEFRLNNPDYEAPELQLTPDENGVVTIGDDFDPFAQYEDTGLTGRFLKSASVQFSQGVQGGAHTAGFAGEPYIALAFDKEGADLFAEITRDNVGEALAIFLDGSPISVPVIQTEIPNGEATITGDFSPEEARTLVGRLNSGALPVPIELVSTQSIGPSLGAEAIDAAVMAGLYGFLFVSLFLLAWYRLPGFLAVFALAMYAVAMVILFKLIPITLTAAGLAGFIISLGIAVDANILIFERMKEEIRFGRSLYDAIKTGFNRAWASIRDANISSLISAVVLFAFGTSLIQGFALTFGIGVLISMITAITVTKFFLLAFAGRSTTKTKKLLFGTGLR